MTREEELRAALEAAPDKFRIDFQPYWDWYDGPRAQALARPPLELVKESSSKK